MRVSRWDAELNPRLKNMKTLPPLQESSAFVPQGSTFLEWAAFYFPYGRGSNEIVNRESDGRANYSRICRSSYVGPNPRSS